MEQQIKLMNKYVANLAVLNVKLHNLHWNVTGENFEQVHVFLERLYDDLFIKFDEAAERIKMVRHFPLASLKEYLNTSDVEELESKFYNVKESLSIAYNEYENLIALAKQVRVEADSNDDFITVSLMEDHITIYEKELWFIYSTLKKGE
jgi:starvation-inducible DNA-binding protein